MNEQYLYEKLLENTRDLTLPKAEIPAYISDNLKYSLFDWQGLALENFLLFNQIKNNNLANENINANKPTHLMFNMATGTGKTLVMAATILYYYKQGYRHFIFFVNQNNIVGKTEENLTNPMHNKYLFQPNIVIDNQVVEVKKVERFSDSNDEIQILFTSIHKLHNAIYQVKENQIYLADLQNRAIVMLGDEAHHLNASTKKIKEINFENLELKENAKQADIERSWENTVISRLLNQDKKTHEKPCQNVLLEFTATIPREKTVREKYLDKVIYQFDLQQFLKAGFTKEINLVASDFDKKRRVLQALLFNWYRHEMALKHSIPNFKSVILFRSKYVDTAQIENSQSDYEFFLDLTKNIQQADFDFINEIVINDSEAIFQKGKSRIIDIKNYINENPSERMKAVLNYIKSNFKARNCIITNSKQGTKTKEKTNEAIERLLNNLEDKNNHIRAIFTVKRLTEGWDVLNLFDIVKMYQGKEEITAKAVKSTVSEVQLIGRGIRYYPFTYRDFIPNKRKFDENLAHELRVLEELYFHSENAPKYINELKKELEKQELLPKEENRVAINIAWKAAFNPMKKDSFFNEMQLWQNKRVPNPNRQRETLAKIRQNFEANYDLTKTNLEERTINFNENDALRLKVQQTEKTTIRHQFKAFKTDYKHLILKAINIKGKKANSIYHFNNLSQILNIKTIENIFEDEFLGLFELNLMINKNENLAAINREKILALFIDFFERLETALTRFDLPYIGSEFELKSIENIFTEKKVIITKSLENTALFERMKAANWYAMTGFYGTKAAQNLLLFLETKIADLQTEYQEIALVQNIANYKIYDFEAGRNFTPDFLLFLKKDDETYYQILLDSSILKNENNNNWKVAFLQKINKKYGTKIEEIRNQLSDNFPIMKIEI